METVSETSPKFKLKLEDYVGIAPKVDLVIIQKLADRLAGRHFLHINSTKSGGGVAEILQRMLSILSGLGINTRWEVIEGDTAFLTLQKKSIMPFKAPLNKSQKTCGSTTLRSTEEIVSNSISTQMQFSYMTPSLLP